jgi:hypothetical protein
VKGPALKQQLHQSRISESTTQSPTLSTSLIASSVCGVASSIKYAVICRKHVSIKFSCIKYSKYRKLKIKIKENICAKNLKELETMRILNVYQLNSFKND